MADAAALDKVIDPARRRAGGAAAAGEEPAARHVAGAPGAPGPGARPWVPGCRGGLLVRRCGPRPGPDRHQSRRGAASLSGAADWSEQDTGVADRSPARRAEHGGARALRRALAARRRGRGSLGLALSYAGLGVATGSASVGGHMSYAQSSGVSHAVTAGRALTKDWMDLGPLDDLPEGRPAPDGQGEQRRRPAGRRPPGCPGRRVRRRLRAPVRTAARGVGGGRSGNACLVPLARVGVRPGQRDGAQVRPPTARRSSRCAWRRAA